MIATQVQVPTSWGLTGLDVATADRLYSRVMAQTQAGPQPQDIETAFVDEVLEAAVAAGSDLVADPKV